MGRGVVTTRDFFKGQFVVEYSGTLLTHRQATAKAEEYRQQPSVGCYMMFFRFKDKPCW